MSVRSKRVVAEHPVRRQAIWRTFTDAAFTLSHDFYIDLGET